LWTSDKIFNFLEPENHLEKVIIGTPEFQKGLVWGEPRYGHPEGKVIFHIREIFQNIDKLEIDNVTREKLRIIALSHDTFKFVESKTTPRDWYNHHGPIAARFIENYTSDVEVLTTIELHDEAFYCWRTYTYEKEAKKAELRFENLLNRIQQHIQLYYLFFKCDTETGDKILAPLKWFENKNLEIGFVVLK
jgi:HD domain